MKHLGYGCTQSARLFKRYLDDTGRKRTELISLPTLTAENETQELMQWTAYVMGFRAGRAQALELRDKLIVGCRDWMTVKEICEATGGRSGEGNLSRAHVMRILKAARDAHLATHGPPTMILPVESRRPKGRR